MNQFVFTGFVNLLTYLSVAITTKDADSLLSSIFLFSASIGLEALALSADRKQDDSAILAIAFWALVGICAAGWGLVITGYNGFLDFEINWKTGYPRAIVGLPETSLLPRIGSGSFDVTDAINFCGWSSGLIQFILAARIAVVRVRRRLEYTLKDGFYGK